MIEDKIEIVIPTYNRATYLDKTLNYLFNSPFKDCKITIRDNASPDDTPIICEKHSKLFKNFHVIRNEKNIGGNANIIRSYEKATYPYVWVLADNDILNFDDCDDFIEAIESEKYDLILCCSALYVSEFSDRLTATPEDEPISELIKRARNDDPNYLENPAQELAFIIKKHFFFISTLISSSIYRTSIIDAETLIEGYEYIAKTYPHYPIIAKILNNNLLTYKTKNDVIFMQPNPEDVGESGFGWYVKYLAASVSINDKELQSYAGEYLNSTLYHIIAFIICAKAFNEKRIKENVISLIKVMYELKGWFVGFLYHILILICYCTPKIICDYALKIKLNNND